MAPPPLVVGGRSAGARVGLPDGRGDGRGGRGLPVVPAAPTGQARAQPGRGAGRGRGCRCSSSRAPRDPFGTPAEVAALGVSQVTVVEVPGDHGLSPSAPAVAAAVLDWMVATVPVG